MVNLLYTTLTSSLKVHFNLSNSRLITLCSLILGFVQSRTVNLSHIASFIPGEALSASRYRRLQRFFQFVQLESDHVAPLVLRLVNLSRPRCLALDRTNWKVGQKDINILMLSIVTRRFRLPLLWTLLDHRGNSNTAQRIALMQRYLRLFDAASIEMLLADREFIGHEWIDFLCKNNIKFAIRMREDQHIILENGTIAYLGSWVKQRRASRIYLSIKGQLKGTKTMLTFLAKQTKTKEWLIIATNETHNPKRAIGRYRQRWGVECLFGDMKTRGFNLEDTRLTNKAKINTLLVVLTLAMTWGYACATRVQKLKSIRRKTHGRREKSFFRIGYDALRNWINLKPEKAANVWRQKCPKNKISI